MNKLMLTSSTTIRTLIIGLAVVGVLAFAILSASAQEQPTIKTVVRNTGGATTTSASIGTILRADVMIASTTGPVATSSVDFHRFPNITCSGSATVENNVQLVNGFAQSGTTTMPATGLSYKVHYDGETNLYPPSDGECVGVQATGPNTSITTTLSSSTIAAGLSVHDSAILLNNTGNASGTVAYKVYSNNACSTLFANAGVKAVSNGSVPNSDSIQFNAPGTYFWQAVYSGDSLNAAATSTCTSEILTVLATSTPKGRIIVDKVTSPSGATTTFSFDVTGSGYSDFTLTDQSAPNNQELNLGTYTITESSVSGWNLTSARCSVNGAASTTYALGSNLVLGTNDTINCTFTNTRVATGTGSISGTKYNDLDKDGTRDSGEPGLSGWTIKLYGTERDHGNWWRGNKWGFWKKQEVRATATTDANGNYSFTNLEPGTYIVKEEQKDGWKQIEGASSPITLAAGQVVTGINFGNAERSSHDDDEDGDDDDKDRGDRPERPHRGADREDDDNDNNGHSSGLGKQIVKQVFERLNRVGISIGEDD